MPRPILFVTALLVLLLGGGVWGGIRFYAARHPGADPQQSQRQAEGGDLRGALLDLRTRLRDHPDDRDAHLRMAELQLRASDPVAAEKEAATALSLGAPARTVALLRGQALLVQRRFQDVLDAVPAEGPGGPSALAGLVLRGTAQIALRRLDEADRTAAEALRVGPDSAEAALIAAELAMARGEADAEAKVDQALRRDPARFEALMLKQRLLLARRDPAGALAIATRAVAAAPWSPLARLGQAELLMQAGQDAAAKEAVDSTLRNQPRSPPALLMRAVLLVRAGNPQAAEPILEALAPLAAVLPRVEYFKAMVAGQLGRLPVAAESAARYVRRVPGDRDGVLLLASAELALMRPAPALAALQTLPDEGRDNARAMDLAGQAHAMLGQAAAAAEAFARAGALAPGNAGIAARAGMLAARTGVGLEPALDRLDTLTEHDPKMGAAVVSAALAAGEFDRAQAALARLRAATGDTETVRSLTGALALGTGDLVGAEAAWTGVLEQSPASVTAELQLARVQVLLGKMKQAEALSAKILERDPANADALALFMPLAMKQEHLKQAEQAVEAARRRRPEDPELALALAQVLVREGDRQRGLDVLKAAAAAAGAGTPAERALMGATAEAQAQAGRLDEARATLDEMGRRGPANTELVLAQSRLALRAGDVPRSRALLAEGLERAPGDYRLLSAVVAAETLANGVDAGLRQADAFRQDPRHGPAAALLRGDALLTAQRIPEAADAFTAAYRQAPSTLLLTRVVGADQLAGRAAAAEAILRERLATAPDDVPALQMLAGIELASKRTDMGQRTLEAILARQPGDVVALNNLAVVYAAQNDARALPTARLAFQKGATAPVADTLGWIMVRQGNAATGLPLLRAAVQEQPADRTMRYHLAAAMAASGQASEGLAALRAVLTDPAPFDERTDAEALLARLEATPKR